MTAKTTVEITATDTNGDPYASRSVKVSLIGSGQGGSVDGVVIVGTTTVHLDATGSGTVALYPNSAITPAGTYYALAVPGTGVVRCITVPSSGPVDWSDNAIQVVDTNDLPVIVPPASAGTTGDALIVNAEGNGYELGAGLTGPQGPAGAAGATGATGPAGADGADGATVDTALTTSADGAPFFRSASTVATWESVAGLVGTPQPVIDQVSGFLPYVVTDAGDTQYGVELNASTVTALALAVAESASAAVVDEADLRNTAVGTETTARQNADSVLNGRIDDVVSGADPIDYTGSGLFTGAAHLSEAASAAEGFLDRLVSFRAVETASNIDVTDLGSAVFQYGSLDFDDGDGGLTTFTWIWLQAQTDPAENGVWQVQQADLSASKKNPPDVFEPPGNGGMRLLSNPTDRHHGMLWWYVDASADKFQRGGGFTGQPSYPSGFGEWVLIHDPCALYLTSPNGTQYAVTVDNAGTLTATAV